MLASLLRSPRLRRLLRFAGEVAVLASFANCGAHASHAADWMYRRSYYSHAPIPGDPAAAPLPGRTAYRPAYTGEGPGFSARGGWRYNTIYLQAGGSVDVQVIREGWFEMRP